ncbi:MAG: RNA methyltransferase [Lachnospiraceae bacterium]|nr:RNA methyltransferase [Lachnospiraceae bacterium]
MYYITETDHLEDPRLQIYTKLSETQLYHCREPHKGLFIAESPKVIERALNAGCKPVSMLMDCQQMRGEGAEVLERIGAMEGNPIPVYTAEEAVLRNLTGFPLTRGCLCAMERRDLPSVEETVRGASRICIMEEVVNPTNVGAIFRSAAALGMDAVLLTHGCADPLYRRAVRVSMGTVFQIPWTFIGDRKAPGWPQPGIDKLRGLGFKTAAMALKKDSVSISDPGLLAEPRLAVILGTEGDGLAEETIAACDYTVMIPMFHGVDSLNVAAASAVAFWELRDRQ